MKIPLLIKLLTVPVLMALCTPQPARAGLIEFGAIPTGTVISSADYLSVGILLFTDAGQHLFVSGSSLVASGNGHVTIEFTLPGTTIPAGVSTFAIYTTDNTPGGSAYTFTGFDAAHQQMFQLGNNHDYLVGDGYSFLPYVHTLEFVPSKPTSQCITRIGFGEIQSVPEPTILLPIALVGLIFWRRR
jgi:hypothetical protein